VLSILNIADSFSIQGKSFACTPTSGISARPQLCTAFNNRLRSPLRDQTRRTSRSTHGFASLTKTRCSAADAARAEQPVVIIGAGVAGLACAISLVEKGIPVTVVEASDGVGGRVRTDKVDGYLLDRGFQIFLTSYPEARRYLDFNQLKLKPFYPGALVRFGGGFHRVADPFRRPIDAIPTLFPTHPIGSIVDKLLIGVLRLQSLIGDLDSLWSRPDINIEQRLSDDVFFGTGFSKEMVDRFFRPFLGGIFFDNKLRTTARELDFVFRMLALGENCLPEVFISIIPQLCPQKQTRNGTIGDGEPRFSWALYSLFLHEKAHCRCTVWHTNMQAHKNSHPNARIFL
jgi:hypothetical protein